MAFEITNNTKSIMDDLETGAAFDTTMLDDMGSLNGQWAGLHAEQDTLFGTYSPIHGSFEGLEDSTPMTEEQLSSIAGLDDDQKASLVGKPNGLLTNLQSHAQGQFKSITDNLSLYTTHQSVQNALGNSQGCGGLSEHFGSIMAQGQGIAAAVKAARVAIDDLKQYKTQVQSEIDSFDENAIGILSGNVNGTIMAKLVKGSGLHDQIDGILMDAGIAKDSAQAQEIRAKIGERLTPNINDFYNKKSKANAEVKKINDARGGILGQISKELTVLNKATTTLRRLGAANNLQGLFKANECAQTLLGFVASSNFLGKLGG
jgi:hypothetical protein